jgi:hypothetical protein
MAGGRLCYPLARWRAEVKVDLDKNYFIRDDNCCIVLVAAKPGKQGPRIVGYFATLGAALRRYREETARTSGAESIKDLLEALECSEVAIRAAGGALKWYAFKPVDGKEPRRNAD